MKRTPDVWHTERRLIRDLTGLVHTQKVLVLDRSLECPTCHPKEVSHAQTHEPEHGGQPDPAQRA